MHEIKCDNCGKWTPGHLEYCQQCGKLLRSEEKLETAKRKSRGDLKPKLIKIYPYDEWYVVMGKHVIRFGQVLFYLIVSIVVWVTSWTIG